MPYDVIKSGNKYTVKKGGKTVGHTDKQNLRAYMGHLHSGDEHKKAKKTKKEGIEGALDQVYAVQKPYSGCQMNSLVQPIDPLRGLEGSEVMPDKVHAVYPNQEMAQKMAETLYNEHLMKEKALEEKKGKVVDEIKKVMNVLEKKRKDHTDMIKENPKEASQHKQTVAELSHKLEELITTLERVEMSRKNLEEEDHDKKKDKDKKDLKEALKKLFEKEKEFTFKKAGKKGEEGTVKAETPREAQKKAYKKGADLETVKQKKEKETKTLKEGFLSLDTYEKSPKEDYEYRVVYFSKKDKKMKNPLYQTLFSYQQPSKSVVNMFLDTQNKLGKIVPVLFDKNDKPVPFSGESDDDYRSNMNMVGFKDVPQLGWQAG